MRKRNNNNIVNIIIIIGIVFLIASLLLMLLNKKSTDNHIIEINYSEYSDKINEDNYNIILLTSPACMHCKSFKPYVNYVADNNNLTIYDLNTSILTYDQYFEIHEKYTAIMDRFLDDGTPSISTPTTIITKNGEEIDSISGDIGYTGLLEFLKKNEIIK